MTRSYLAPDPRDIFKEHARRIGVLERRLNPATTASRRRSPGVFITVAAANTLPELATGATYQCDGTADQVEIQAAIDQVLTSGAGGTVFLLAGQFNTSATITLKSGVSVEGERGTFIFYVGGGYALSNDNAGTGHDRITLRHLVIQSPDGGGVQFAFGSSFCIIDACEISCGDNAPTTLSAVQIQGVGNRIVGSSVSTEAETYAVSLVSFLPSETIVSGNTIRGPGGVTADGCDRLLISGNNINAKWTGSFSGVRLTGSSEYCTVVGNLIDDFGRHGIVIDNSSHNTIADNTIVNAGRQTANTYDGIRLEGAASENNIQGNTARNASPGGRYGISIAAGCIDNLVTNNDLLSHAHWASGAALSDAGTGTVVTPGNRPGGGAVAHSHADADIPASIARDTEVTAAISTHAAATDPHTGYATDADLTAHAATPHGGGAHPDLAAHDTLGLATQAELDAHAATAHGGAGSGDEMVPYYVPAGVTFTVLEYAQALYHLPIEVDGALDVEGLLVEIGDPPDLSALLAMEPG